MLFLEEASLLSQFPIDGRICIENELTGEKGDIRGKPPIVIEGGVDVEAVLEANLVVLLAMAWGGVDASRSYIQGHEIAED